MKLKHILIVSLILAILTIGAVSASDDADNLTAVDDTAAISTDDVAQTVSQVEEVDVIAEDTSDVSEVLGDDRSNIGFDIYCYDQIAGPSFDGEGGDYDKQIRISIYDYSEANVTMFLDGNKTDSFPAYEVYYDTDSHFINLRDYDLSFGMHSARFVFDGDDNYKPFDITKEFEFYYIKDITPDEIRIGSWRTFGVSLARDAEGTLTLLIDGKEVFSAPTESLREDFPENSGIFIELDDINLESDLEFGPHSYELRYSDGTYDNKTFTGTFNLSYEFRVESDYLEETSSVTYGKSVGFDVFIPDDASAKNIILIANGKTYPVELDSNDVFIFNDLAYGENNLTFIYQDDKYPKKNVTWIFNAVARINVPYEFVFNDGETIGLILPSDAQGNLELYYAVTDEDTGDLTVGDLIKSAPLNNGVANISVSNMKFGRYNIIAKYTGDDYDVPDVSGEIIVSPDVDYKFYYWVDGDNKLFVTSPDGLSGNFSISIIYNYYDDEYNWETIIIPLYEWSASAKLNITLPKLNVTSFGYYGDGDGSSYRFEVKYLENDEELFEGGYVFNVKADNPVWEMECDFPKTVEKNDEIDWSVNNIPHSLYSGYVIVYIDGIQVSRVGYDDEEYFDDENYIPSDIVNALDYGNHTWKMVFVDSWNYYENATQNGTFEVSWINIPSEITVGEYNIYFDTGDENATGYLTLLIDGKEYATEFVEDGSAIIDLENLAVGTHTYELTYSGDKNHEKSTKTGTLTVKMLFSISIDDDDVLPLRESYTITVDLPDDATGNVLISIGGNNYTGEVINGNAEIIVTGLTEGEYSLVAKYSGDSKYPSQEITRDFEIDGYRVIIEYDDSNVPTSFTLVLPSDATGDLVVYDEGADSEIGRTSLIDGKATILISNLDLKFRDYWLKIYYSSDDYYVESGFASFVLSPIVNITECVVMGERAKVDIDVDYAEGNITIFVNGEEFATEEIKDGKVSALIPSDKLNLGENIVTLKYVGDDLSEYIFSIYDYDVEDYVPTEYYVYVAPKNLTIPDDFASDGTGNITLELPEGSSGNVTVYVDGEKVSTTPVTGGSNTIPVSDLSAGNHHVRVEYEDENGQTYSTSSEVNVPKPEPAMDIATPTDSANPEFSVSLPEDATGSLIVTIDGKSYTADLVNGKATVSVPGLADGNHNVTVKYTGDKKYSGFTKNTNVVVNTTPKKEDTPQPPAKKADKITLKLNKVKKVKRSAKKLVIKATLKINGKAVKGKKLKFKFNKKTYTAKTNKKGVAKITIKKKVLKKLKVGKKVKIQVSYGKKTAKQKVKVKK